MKRRELDVGTVDSSRARGRTKSDNSALQHSLQTLLTPNCSRNIERLWFCSRTWSLVGQFCRSVHNCHTLQALLWPKARVRSPTEVRPFDPILRRLLWSVESSVTSRPNRSDASGRRKFWLRSARVSDVQCTTVVMSRRSELCVLGRDLCHKKRACVIMRRQKDHVFHCFQWT